MGAHELTGGAWRTGDKSEFRPMGEYLESNGLAVAVVTYRLTTEATPDVRHPAHVCDVYDALKYLVEHAHELGFMPRLTLVGHSVGAWMALGALTTHQGGMPELDARVASHIDRAVLVVRVVIAN